jgi:hypothetical protein
MQSLQISRDEQKAQPRGHESHKLLEFKVYPIMHELQLLMSIHNAQFCIHGLQVYVELLFITKKYDSQQLTQLFSVHILQF